MGGEFGQWQEWHHDRSLDWHLLNYQRHVEIQGWVRSLNQLYRSELALHEFDFEPHGFEWIDCNDADQSVISFIRKGRLTNDIILVVCNFTSVPRYQYRVGVPRDGFWKELANSDAREFGGNGYGNFGGVSAEHIPWHGRPYSLNLTVPPLSVEFFKG
jgi:1,4-alpha-glucan branching enzyme